MFRGTNTNNSTNKKTENNTIWKKYNYSKSIETRNFNHEQVQRIIFSETSDRNWELAYPHIINLINLLDIDEEKKDIASIEININYKLERRYPAEAQSLKETFNVPIYTFGDDSEENIKGALKISNFRKTLNECYDESIILDNTYSPPLRLTINPDITVLENAYFEKKVWNWPF